MDGSPTALSDARLLLVLSHVTAETGVWDPDGEPLAADEDEARDLLAALLREGSEREGGSADAILPDHDAAVATGRALLDQLLATGATAAVTRELLAAPPEDSQLSLELAAGGAVVLGATIAWLQTQIDITVSREDGRTSWRFAVSKEAAGRETLREIVAVLRDLLRPGG